jgi:hypothetical protein
VAAAYVVVSIPTRIWFLSMAARSVGLTLTEFASSLSGVAQASLVLIGTTSAARLALEATTAPPWLRLTAIVGLGIGVYVPMCIWRVPEMRIELDRIRRDGWRAAVTGG